MRALALADANEIPPLSSPLHSAARTERHSASASTAPIISAVVGASPAHSTRLETGGAGVVETPIARLTRRSETAKATGGMLGWGGTSVKR